MNYFTEEEAVGALTQPDAPADPNAAFFERLRKAGVPVRELKSADPNDPVVKSLGRQSNPARTPGAATQAAMSFATKPEQQARIGAGMGADIAGLRVGDDGTMEGVSAEGVSFPLQAPFGLSTLPGFVARGVGEVPTMAGGIAGGAAAGPGSLVVGPVLAGVGSGLGDLARQGIAAYLDPSAQGFSPDLWQTGKEAAFGAGGQLLGAAAGRAIAPVNPGITAKELQGLREGPTLDRARAAYAVANAEGVLITPGQATGLPSLLAREDVAARSPWGMDTAAEFYGRQGDALETAGRRVVGEISPAAGVSKTDAALNFADHAAEAAGRVRRMGNDAAREAYRAADEAMMPSPHGADFFRRQQDYLHAKALFGGGERPDWFIPPYGGRIPEQQGAGPAFQPFRLYDILWPSNDVKTAYNAAVASAANDGIKLPSLGEVANGATIPFQGWDHMKKVLQGMAEEAARAGNNYRATQLTDFANAVKNEVIKVNPSYAEALDIVRPYQAMADELKRSSVTRAGNTDVSALAGQIVNPVFARSNPEYIKATRQAFIDTNGEQAWNNAVGAFVRDQMDQASTSATGLNAAMLRRNLIGKEDTRAALEAAMTPQQFQGFSRFMDTVENVARTFPQNSLTQPRAAMAKQMEQEAATGPAVRAGQAVTFLGPKALRVFEAAGARIQDWGTERNLRASLQYLFTPDGLPMLEALAKTRPGTQNALNITGQIMARSVSPGGSATTPTPSQPARPRSVEELLLQ